MTKTEIAKLATEIVGTSYTTPSDGTGVVTGVWQAQGQVWVGITISGGGFNGSTLKTAVRVEDFQASQDRS